MLGLDPPARAAFDLDLLVGQVVRAGLTVDNAEAAREVVRFADVGALAFTCAWFRGRFLDSTSRPTGARWSRSSGLNSSHSMTLPARRSPLGL